MPEAKDTLPYRVLARKYRPVDFTTLVGQEAMVRTLRNAIASGRIAHAFMLTGVRGVGKTTTARIIARALNCVGKDGKGGATVEIRKVPVTVLSRCQRFDLKRVPQQTLIDHFSKIAGTEKVEISPEALTLLARAADGSVRDGLSMLDQAIAHGGGVVDAAQVRDMLGLADRSRVLELFEKTMRGDAPSVVAALAEMHDSGADPVVILQDLLELTHWVTRLKVAPDAAAASADSERAQGQAMAAKLSMASLTRAWMLLMKGLQETLSAPSPLRAAEMALIRLCYAADLPSPSDAIKALQNGAAVSAPAGAPAAASPRGGGGAAARLATQPVTAVADQ